MKVFRISRTKFAKDLEGIGAKLNGGRWNHIGTPCLYTAESRALAILEYSVNVNIEFIPRNLSITTFEINEDVLHTFSIKKLPGDWQASPASFSTKEFGTQLLKKGIPILKLPSSVIPEEYNYIINPAIILQQPKLIKIVEVKDCVYDVRIKNV